jgi:hypothetical protein
LAAILHIFTAKGASHEIQKDQDVFPFQETDEEQSAEERETPERQPESAAASSY